MIALKRYAEKAPGYAKISQCHNVLRTPITYQHGNVSEGRLQRLIQDIGNLVLEILGSNKWIQQHLASLTQHGVNLTASSSKVLIVVESFPKGKNRLRAGLGTGIQKDAHLGVEDTTKSVEEPSVGINLLGVLLLQTEHHLHRRKAGRIVIAGANKLLGSSYGELSGVLELHSG